jgi:hypothetical protein
VPPAGSPLHGLIEELCLGDKDAQTFLLAFHRWVHWLDDVADGEPVNAPKLLALTNTEWFAVVAHNPFFRRHSDGLTALIIQSMAAWVDSNEWATRVRTEHRVASDVLKGFYHEVFWHTAALVGGLEHLLAMTAKHREFDFDSCITDTIPAVMAAG